MTNYKVVIIDFRYGIDKSYSELYDCTAECLNLCGHKTTIKLDLESLTNEELNQLNGIFIHPNRREGVKKDLDKIMQIKEKYPHIGIIITTGVSQESKEFHQFFRDEDGIYVLLKPCGPDQIIAALDDFYSNVTLQKTS